MTRDKPLHPIRLCVNPHEGLPLGWTNVEHR
jgi:hypothetical protein